MSDQHPFESLGLPPVEVNPAPPSADPEPSILSPEQPPAPPRDPFWGYSDLAIFVGLLFASALASFGLMALIFSFVPKHDQYMAFEAVIGESFLYVLAYGALALLFRANYGRPFWASLSWNSLQLPAPFIVAAGVATAFAVAFLGVAIHTPTTSNPITEMLENPTSLVLITIFGVTLAPVGEELGFRGFLQPLLVRSVGPAPGILSTAVLFGMLHFSEYGNSWRHAVLISLAGAAFGWMRYRTGSTKASALMHASYNALDFVVYFLQPKDLHHT
jgi:uncharacterized protein